MKNPDENRSIILFIRVHLSPSAVESFCFSHQKRRPERVQTACDCLGIADTGSGGLGSVFRFEGLLRLGNDGGECSSIGDGEI